MNTKKNNRVELVKARVTKEEKDIIRKKASFYGNNRKCSRTN